ncbi:MAG: ABC transporter substrate-binding protein [Oscillospiraceae bacterium]|nr:ABC transporter substrate-binding protein [Oscillospiraceae bacterium]
MKMKKLICIAMALAMLFTLAACGSSSTTTASTSNSTTTEDSGSAPATYTDVTEDDTGDDAAENTVYKVGICNYVDDASLNQIVENIQSQLEVLGEFMGVTFEVSYDNPNADSTIMNQIIANFIADDVDIMVGVATPVAMAMQAATEDNQIPVVFAAVSDPVGTGIMPSWEASSSNITGTSDYFDATAVINLMVAADPDIDCVGLLYDVGQDSSTTAIATAKDVLTEMGIEYKEYTGTNTSEVMLAVESLIADGVDAVFTPSDNTIMTAELSIYESLAEAGIPHYTGADSFALNGAFLGYGVDYAELGVQTANIIADILVEGEDISTYPVVTFENGIVTVNTETCETIGFDFDEIAAAFEPLCTQLNTIVTAESFGDLEQ